MTETPFAAAGSADPWGAQEPAAPQPETAPQAAAPVGLTTEVRASVNAWLPKPLGGGSLTFGGTRALTAGDDPRAARLDIIREALDSIGDDVFKLIAEAKARWEAQAAAIVPQHAPVASEGGFAAPAAAAPQGFAQVPATTHVQSFVNAAANGPAPTAAPQGPPQGSPSWLREATTKYGKQVYFPDPETVSNQRVEEKVKQAAYAQYGIHPTQLQVWVNSKDFVAGTSTFASPVKVDIKKASPLAGVLGKRAIMWAGWTPEGVLELEVASEAKAALELGKAQLAIPVQQVAAAPRGAQNDAF